MRGYALWLINTMKIYYSRRIIVNYTSFFNRIGNQGYLSSLKIFILEGNGRYKQDNMSIIFTTTTFKFKSVKSLVKKLLKGIILLLHVFIEPFCLISICNQVYCNLFRKLYFRQNFLNVVSSSIFRKYLNYLRKILLWLNLILRYILLYHS